MRGLRVIVRGAGLSVRALRRRRRRIPTTRELDALLAIAQMPPAVTVGCVGVGEPKNAAALAARLAARGAPPL
jgi:hypothetical protein